VRNAKVATDKLIDHIGIGMTRVEQRDAVRQNHVIVLKPGQFDPNSA
jgi:hypothetical protein